MRINGKKEKQHYVPQFLLRNFSFNKYGKRKRNQQQLYVFDKRTDRTFISNIGDIATEKAFYDFYVGEETRSLEPSLSGLEHQASQAIAKIIENENLSCLSEEEKVWLSLFVTVQYLRVKNQREVIKDMMSQMEKKLIDMGFNPNEVDGFEKLTDEEIKKLSLQSFSKDLMHYAQYIGNKNLLLFKFPDNASLYISDNPVTLHNDNKRGFWGNIGLAVKGIQIYLPISKNMALAFWCDSIQDFVEKALSDVDLNMNRMKAIALLGVNVNRQKFDKAISGLQETYNHVKSFHDCAINGTAFLSTKDNAVFLNSLQVQYANQYIYSYKNEFSLVQKMISDNEQHRRGLRMSVS